MSKLAPVDGRLLELQFLAQLEREERTSRQGYVGQVSAEQQMIASLLAEGYLNDQFEAVKTYYPGDRTSVFAQIASLRDQQLGQFVRGTTLDFRLSHKGRVRLSELRQQLRTGRDRDETGLLWSKRHLETDLRIAVLSASTTAPLSVLFLDMNGLGAINNTYGHSVGDQAIRTFFQTVLATVGVDGEAYRNGGDEVVVVLPNADDERAQMLLTAFAQQMAKDTIILGEDKTPSTLTASCGSVSTTNPAENVQAVLDRADKVQYRAKAKSKKHAPRVTAIAVGDLDVVAYPTPS